MSVTSIGTTTGTIQTTTATSMMASPMEELGEEVAPEEVQKVTPFVGQQQWWEDKCVQYAFAHPHVRARLEKHMGTNLVKLTDKAYIRMLIDRIYVVNEYNLHKRITERQLDEMERLKMLILNGKTPLKDCPPELYHHPVFVFWRLVNKEIAKQSKKRADAYYKKLKGNRKTKALPVIDDDVSREASAAIHMTDEEILQEMETAKLAALEAGYRLTDKEFALLKYESEDIKKLKSLSRVDELYRMAESIVGVPKTL